jgi:hypothetical protein
MNTSSNTRLRLTTQLGPSPRSHWRATGPKNQHTTFRPENAAEHQISSPLTNTGRTGEHHRLDQSLLVNLATSTKWLYTGQAGAPHRSDRTQPESPTSPNRPTNLQNDPNSNQPQHRTTTNTTRRSPEQNPSKGCTGQTGQEHRSDRCSLGSSG